MCRLRLIRRNQRWSCAGKRNLEHFHWANQNFFSGAARCTTHGKRLFCLWWMQDLYHDTATASGWTILFPSNQSKFLRTGNGYAKDLSTLFSSVCIRRRVKGPAPDRESPNQAGSPIRWFSLIWFVGGEHWEGYKQDERTVPVSWFCISLCQVFSSWEKQAGSPKSDSAWVDCVERTRRTIPLTQS